MPSPEPTLRRDAQRTRDRLIEATGALLEHSGPDFTLPELAKEAGVGTATVYRHFADTTQAHQEFEKHTVAGLSQLIRTLPSHLSGRQRFERICAGWVKRSQTEVAPARFIRSPQGFLERQSRQQEPQMNELAAALRSALQDLIGEGVLPDQDLDIAALLWITLFDERVVVDLTRSRRWSANHIAVFLGDALLRTLGATTDPLAEGASADATRRKNTSTGTAEPTTGSANP
ncbi:TetR/AcrR family transcriptional regulator [Nakamurella silvestris]|nr:TetR/AcrR family transcriptional regulator [Nakamurella silvestris]